MPYRVLLGRKAERVLLGLRIPERERIKRKLLELEKNPQRRRPGADIKRLKGTRRLYRLRIGKWRAVYGIHEGDVIVTDLFLREREYGR